MNATWIPALIIFGATIIIIAIMAFSRRKQIMMAFTLHEDGENRLEISSDGKWRSTDIRLDGKLAATLSKGELFKGYDLTLQGGSVLQFKLKRHFMQRERIQITVNGQSIRSKVTGVENDMIIHNAAGLLFMIAAINLIIGFISIYFKPEGLIRLGLGWQNIAFGLVYVILGIFTGRKSALALILFILIFGVDSVAFVILSLVTLNWIFIFILLFRMAFLSAAFIALGEIYQRRGSPVAGPIRIVGIVLIILSLVGFCGGTTWAFTNAFVSIRQLTEAYPNLVPHRAASPTPGVVAANSGCSLKVKDTAESVNIRDQADSSTGKVVGVLYRGDIANVIGSDGGLIGNAWWLIAVKQDGNNIQGWVTGKYVELGNEKGCVKVPTVATPYP